MGIKNTKMTNTDVNLETTNEIIATPIIDRWDTLPTEPIDGQFGYYNVTRNFKIWIKEIGWGTTAVTFLPSDNIK